MEYANVVNLVALALVKEHWNEIAAGANALESLDFDRIEQVANAHNINPIAVAVGVGIQWIIQELLQEGAKCTLFAKELPSSKN